MMAGIGGPPPPVLHSPVAILNWETDDETRCQTVFRATELLRQWQPDADIRLLASSPRYTISRCCSSGGRWHSRSVPTSPTGRSWRSATMSGAITTMRWRGRWRRKRRFDSTVTSAMRAAAAGRAVRCQTAGHPCAPDETLKTVETQWETAPDAVGQDSPPVADHPRSIAQDTSIMPEWIRYQQTWVVSPCRPNRCRAAAAVTSRPA